MPGIVVFRRRWSVGSDDLIVPASFLVIVHCIWLALLGLTFYSTSDLDLSNVCMSSFVFYLVAFLVLWSLALIIEVLLSVVSLRGTILEDEPRWMAEYLLYVKLVLWLVEIGLTIGCAFWIKDHYFTCELPTTERSLVLGLVIFNFVIFLTAIITIWCVFDVAGRSWVKLKNYQKSQKDQDAKSKLQYKRSGGKSSRNWRQRKVRRAYQSSWDNRFHFLFCCVHQQNRKTKSSFADIARVLSEFFRDLDVVPSDVIVGLLLLRQRQQLASLRVVRQPSNSVFTFLSGVRVTPETQFLDVAGEDLPMILEIHHFMHYAVGIYGWPMYLRKNTGISTLKLCSSLRCSSCLPCCPPKPQESMIVDDNFCGCNFAAYQRMCNLPDTCLIYVTYHVDVGETPFLIAIDYTKQAIVLSIRGTLSLQDVLTDLNAEGEPLPVRPVNEEWVGHKGMVDAASYIYKKVKDEHLLTKAFNWDKDRGTDTFNIVCVGHSLGAGTAAILAIMLKQEYPATKCFSFSPPGGLLSKQAVEFSRSFITSVVLGKDVVPRIGLHQLESLRHNLIGAIHESNDPKWKTLISGFSGFINSHKEWIVEDPVQQLTTPATREQDELTDTFDLNIHPWDSSVNLSVHQPLYPPGQIIHIVRNYPKPSAGEHYSASKRRAFKRGAQPIFKAIMSANESFDEVLISKRMVQDHMPDNVLDALEKMLEQNNAIGQIYDSVAYVKGIHRKESGSSGNSNDEEIGFEV